MCWSFMEAVLQVKCCYPTMGNRIYNQIDETVYHITVYETISDGKCQEKNGGKYVIVEEFVQREHEGTINQLRVHLTHAVTPCTVKCSSTTC